MLEDGGQAQERVLTRGEGASRCRADVSFFLCWVLPGRTLAGGARLARAPRWSDHSSFLMPTQGSGPPCSSFLC